MGKGPHHRAKAVVIDLGLGCVFEEEEDERENHRHDDQELQRNHHLLTLRTQGLRQQTERAHIAEDAQQSGHSQHLEDRVGNRYEVLHIEGEGREDVDQTVEREAVANASPEASVFVVAQVGHPDAQNHLDGEDYERDVVILIE